VYVHSGMRTDEKGKFNGWTCSYDEWLDVTHPRIQRYNSVAKKLYTKASSSN